MSFINCIACNVRQSPSKRCYKVKGGYVGSCLVADSNGNIEEDSYICGKCYMKRMREAQVYKLIQSSNLYVLCIHI